jgi:transposase-like protein
MAGRRTKYTPELVQRIVNALEAGATQKDACAYADIHVDTFHEWRKTKSAFSEAVTRAEGQARFHATLAIKNAVKGAEQVTTTNDVITETRLRKVKDANGNVVEEPYIYKKTVTGQTVTKFPPDWRAAVEYLKRRDSEHWSDRTNVKLETWESELVALLKAGTITPEQITAELETSLAERLFIAAGVPATSS